MKRSTGNSNTNVVRIGLKSFEQFCLRWTSAFWQKSGRPAVSTKRLSITRNGRVRYELNQK